MKAVLVIALNTFREIIRDRILYGLVVFAVLLIGFSLALGQLSFVEQVRISANFGFTGIHLSAVMLAIFVGGSLVAKEIDKKTILTVLVRPISRLQFLVGKSLGLTAVLAVVIMGLALVLSAVLFAIGFDFNAGFLWGLVGVLLEATVLLGITLFFSTFAKPLMVASFVLGVFLVGHWLDSLQFFVNKSKSIAYRYFGEAVVAVFPNLEVFNWRSLAVYGDELTLERFVSALGYSFFWYNFFLFFAFLVMRRKDLG